ncbi:MAG: orotidine-5'-phosphate decarboxylase [Candidatus Moranbacteria bacterium]|nr:orotidine-5'-phosphate decarboxylase [Candidatus Moranbacteria bacterium]
MPQKTFTDRLIAKIQARQSILCVGLDPQIKQIPAQLKQKHQKQYPNPYEAVARCIIEFNQKIIDATAPYAAVFKPQIAFYEQYGAWGVWAFEATLHHLEQKGELAIADVKRGDGGQTAQAYQQGYCSKIDLLNGSQMESLVKSPALTINVQTGDTMVKPFVQAAKNTGQGVFALVKTSFQPNSVIENLLSKQNRPFWREIALFVAKSGQGTEGEYGYRNFGIVAGATFPDETQILRKILPNSWFLVPGYGAQGASAREAVTAANKDGLGIVVNSSRSINYAYLKQPKQPQKPAGQSIDFVQAAAQAAKKARDELNQALNQANKSIVAQPKPKTKQSK